MRQPNELVAVVQVAVFNGHRVRGLLLARHIHLQRQENRPGDAVKRELEK